MSRACSISSLLLVLLLIVSSESLGLSVPRASSVSRRLRSTITAHRSTSTAKKGTLLLLNATARGGGASKGNGVASPVPSLSKLSRSISRGYRARVAADPNFLIKSVLEVALAAGTQFAAELNRRGGFKGCLTQIDFVVAGVLTAIAGKYYSAWRVAPTAKIDGDDNDDAADSSKDEVEDDGFWSTKVPSNAFQPYLMDGVTRPTLIERLASLVAPIPTLFRAGVIASAIGYGLTSVLITLRTLLVPDYVAQTVNINIIHACVYTGAFMSIVSNIRYQLLQGLIEPKFVDRFFGRWPPVQAALTFAVRLANGLLGSMIAIAGMKWLGLQKLKS